MLHSPQLEERNEPLLRSGEIRKLYTVPLYSSSEYKFTNESCAITSHMGLCSVNKFHNIHCDYEACLQNLLPVLCIKIYLHIKLYLFKYVKYSTRIQNLFQDMYEVQIVLGK